MYLNTLQPAKGSKFKAKILGRGIGTGLGKTCGKGHKGQKARAGGYHKIGFEGGQTPYKRRVAKLGFTSKKSSERQELRLSELNIIKGVIDINTLRTNKLVTNNKVKSIKIIATGELKHACTVMVGNMLKVTKGAQSLIEKLGGKVLVEQNNG